MNMTIMDILDGNIFPVSVDTSILYYWMCGLVDVGGDKDYSELSEAVFDYGKTRLSKLGTSCGGIQHIEYIMLIDVSCKLNHGLLSSVGLHRDIFSLLQASSSPASLDIAMCYITLAEFILHHGKLLQIPCNYLFVIYY